MAPTQRERWLQIIANLRVDRKNDIAPHKPLLLLVVAELIEEGKLSSSTLRLTGELTFRFTAYWTIVSERRSQKPDIRLPFFHLSSDGCWTPLDSVGNITSERKRAAAVEIAAPFFELLNDNAFRIEMRRIIIAKYFVNSTERIVLYDLVRIPVPPSEVVKADAKLFEIAKDRGREARFRLTVIPAYNYTCALTRYRLVTIQSGCIVDAAHIHQFSDSRNNYPQNGISLCKNAHWLFDQGLWSLTDDYKVIVATHRFEESGEDALLLKKHANNQILLPTNSNYWPRKDHLEWHRKHKFSNE